MSYRVVWRPPALDRMSEFVRDNPEWRTRFAAALREMTDRLTADPTDVGESRDGPYRLAVFGPLTVTFRPAPDEGVVYVTEVHLPD